jgi:hypothetical protein
MRGYTVFLFALLFVPFTPYDPTLAVLTSRAQPTGSSPSVIQELDIQRTPDGPVVQGMFGRFALPATPD